MAHQLIYLMNLGRLFTDMTCSAVMLSIPKKIYVQVHLRVMEETKKRVTERIKTMAPLMTILILILIQNDVVLIH